MIEKIQKQYLLEQASKKGIFGSKLQQIPEIYRALLGTTDIGQRTFGAPLTPIYMANPGEEVNVPKISNFFEGLVRDIKVADYSISQIEDQLLFLNLEVWNRLQLLKNKSLSLSKRARVERTKVSTGAIWSYTETFSLTNLIDMENTTLWLDTSEGIAFLPNLGNESIINPSQIKVISTTVPTNGDFLGSNPSQAYDGLNNTNWRSLFVDSSSAETILELPNETNLTAISIDPVGFGVNVTISLDNGSGFKESFSAIIYHKKTFAAQGKNVKKVKISFKPSTSVLPKVAGIREIVFYNTNLTRFAEVISKLLKPSEPFTELKIDPKGDFPSGSKVTTFFRTTSGGAWKELKNNDWNPISSTDTANYILKPSDAVASNSFVNYRGLYGIQVSSPPLSVYEGKMAIGTNMVEVQAFNKDWSEVGELPKLLSLEDFKNNLTQKTWSNVPSKSISPSSIVAQGYGQTTVSSDSSLIRGGDYFLFQRKLTSDDLSSEITQYNQLVFVPVLSSSGIARYGYNYKVKFMVYTPKAFHFDNAKYWFLQGYRETGRRSYKDLGKSFCSFSLYINGNSVVRETTPYTIFQNGTTDSPSSGKGYTLALREGWNTVEILLNVVDPQAYGTDSFDSGPYVQLSLYPSLFDPAFQSETSHYISDVVASDITKPSSEFDLLWNLPADPSFWAWSTDRSAILFNTNKRKYIDGSYNGSSPDNKISYKSLASTTIDDLYVKVSLEKSDNSPLGPTLNEYTVMVR